MSLPPVEPFPRELRDQIARSRGGMIAVRYDIVRDPITQWQPKVKVDESKREILDSDLPRGVAWWRYYHQFVFNHLNHGFHVSVVPHA